MKRIILLIMVASSLMATAQNHKKHHRSSEFDFTARVSLNGSQIDGDGSGGYSHLGFNAGVNTSFPLGEGGFRMTVELGLSQKGSIVNSLNRNISLYYFEVPLMLTYRAVDDKLDLGLGIAPAFLGRAHVTDGGAYNQVQSSNYRKMDLLPFVASAQYLFSDHLGINVRFNTSLLNVGIENGSGTYRLFRSNRGQFNRLVSAGVAYRF